MNHPGIWIQENDMKHTFLTPGYALYGMVFKIEDPDNWWGWEARTRISCNPSFSNPFRGKAPTLAGAKTIVEVLLIETETVPPHPQYKKRCQDSAQSGECAG